MRATFKPNWYKLDALAHFGEVARPTLRRIPDEHSRELAAILARRRQVVGMLVAERNRLETVTSPVRGLPAG